MDALKELNIFIDWIYQQLYALSSMSGLSAGILGVLIGLVFLFAGYRLRKLTLFLAGFLAGFLLLTFIGGNYLEISAGYQIGAALVGGLVLGILALFIYRFALYLLGFALGGYLGYAVAMQYLDNPVWGILIGVVLALILGMIIPLLERPLFIVISALVGFFTFRLGLGLLISGSETILLEEIVSVVLLLVGIFFQFRSTRHLRDRREEKKHRERRLNRD
ncbi:MAG: TMEM198/TM7SF3 family protein [Spirochaetales bacterium]|nr:TMEM198/TM7SF3 family protein [Spirochaetales bacterium]MCF7939035.1 TMEM198/TM7SF3 family protein [Spirochaetales bacterium]